MKKLIFGLLGLFITASVEAGEKWDLIRKINLTKF